MALCFFKVVISLAVLVLHTTTAGGPGGGPVATTAGTTTAGTTTETSGDGSGSGSGSGSGFPGMRTLIWFPSIASIGRPSIVSDVILDCGLPCGACQVCNLNTGVCETNTNTSTVCRLSSGPCESNATCDGVNDFCPPSFRPSSYKCRLAAGPCDADDFCDGGSVECNNTLRVAGENCSSAVDPCEDTARCNGIDITCPTNPFLLAGTFCNQSCDVNQTCSGSSKLCPAVNTPCSGSGACNSNVCVCGAGFTGASCEQYAFYLYI
jgi:hypothetical protein